MERQDAKKTLDLLFAFTGLFHEKFLHRFRKNHEHLPLLKKNHVKIISMLYRFNSLTSTEIAKKLDIEKGSVTTLIDQLVEAGLVTRGCSPHDRRKSLIWLTDLGKIKMENIIASDINTITEILGTIPPQDLQEFIDSLIYVVEIMNKL